MQRLVVDKGLGVEIERSEDGWFSRDDIAKALRLAMVSDEGEKLGLQAREAARVFGNQNMQDSYFNRFVEYLKKMELQIKQDGLIAQTIITFIFFL
ncbi:hypothetical protein PVK06_044054 [Gossypium arboreum]|uniref:Uncharacterized protein n=1 Tax=Gossypium arboreum TaxID=29729 RepID=A0ABR0MQ84_GOSAR|nr:hypothetical protein PVK06_044054 [Gossypium arboreum]